MSPSERSVGRRTPSRGPCGSRPGRPTFGWCPGSRVRRGGRGPSRQPRCRPSIRAAWQIAATGSADSKNGVGRQSGAPVPAAACRGPEAEERVRAALLPGRAVRGPVVPGRATWVWARGPRAPARWSAPSGSRPSASVSGTSCACPDRRVSSRSGRAGAGGVLPPRGRGLHPGPRSPPPTCGPKRRYLRAAVAGAARASQGVLLASGTPVVPPTAPIPVTDAPRRHRMDRHFGELVDGRLGIVCGCHVHVGTADRAQALFPGQPRTSLASRTPGPRRELAVHRRPGHRLREPTRPGIRPPAQRGPFTAAGPRLARHTPGTARTLTREAGSW